MDHKQNLMMRRLLALLVTLLVVAGAGLLIYSLRPARGGRSTPQRSAGTPAETTAAAPANAESLPITSPSRPVRPLAAPAPRDPPLRTMTNLLNQMTEPGRSVDELMAFLAAAKQEPFDVVDKNAYTGEMTIVRTKSPFPNTRYFHAQFFTDENGAKFLQHMSFEYKASPTAMNEALAAVQATFPSLGKPMHDTPGFKQWAIRDGYVVWCKKLVADDLRDNPFNAYTAADAGTVRCAVELNPHPHDE